MLGGVRLRSRPSHEVTPTRSSPSIFSFDLLSFVSNFSLDPLLWPGPRLLTSRCSTSLLWPRWTYEKKHFPLAPPPPKRRSSPTSEVRLVLLDAPQTAPSAVAALVRLDRHSPTWSLRWDAACQPPAPPSPRSAPCSRAGPRLHASARSPSPVATLRSRQVPAAALARARVPDSRPLLPPAPRCLDS